MIKGILDKKFKYMKEREIKKLIRQLEKGDIEGINNNFVKNFDSNLRNDLKRKFIFKNVVAPMMKVFRTNIKMKKSLEVEIAFWMDFFCGFCEKNGIKIECVYNPVNIKLEERKFKNITGSYLTNLLNEDRFYAEFMKHLKKVEKEYVEKLDHKVAVYMKIFKDVKLNRKSVDEKLLSLKEQKGTKFPWSVVEVREAVAYIEKEIKKYRKPEAFKKSLDIARAK